MYLFRGWQAARYCCWAQDCGAIRAPGKILPAEIHCLRGTPRRWGLFGENDQEQINNISLGIIDRLSRTLAALHCSGSWSTNRYRYLSRPPRSASGAISFAA